MRTREDSIRIASLSAGLIVIAVSTLPDLLGLSLPGFNLLQFLGMMLGIFLCLLSWLLRHLPSKAVLAIGTTLLTALIADAALEWVGVNVSRKALYVTHVAEQAVVGVDPIGIYQKDLVLGWSHEPKTVGHHKTYDFNVTYTIDEEGCRKIPAPEHPRGTIDILGCSYTFGQGVADDECFPAVLASQYWKNFRVKNHAVSGYGTTQAYLILREILKRPEKPVMVLYGWISHHAMRNYRRIAASLEDEESGGFFPLIELENGTLVEKGVIASEAADWKESEKLRTAERGITIKLLTTMNDMCREKGVPFFLVSVPDRYAKLEINNAVFDAVRKQGVVVIDAWESRNDYFEYDTHPKASWHTDLAKRLANEPALKALVEK